MRNLLIAIVLLLTAGAFYSALWFKSQIIEDDITTRVTAALDEDNATDIGIDVDGRHVTLSGVVYDEATETGYLETADTTYGALGPIDGLTYQADSGYVSAIKTADGITLRGSVGTEAARAALVAEAEAATDGVVDDQLMIAGPDAPWQQEASFGLGQMAGLTAGTLTAAAGSFALSGMTDTDPADVDAAFAEREGWQTLVSSSIGEQDLSADVARLADEIADRDATLGTLETEVATLNADLGTMTTDRDETQAELDALRSNLTEEQSSMESLRAELNDAQGGLADAEGMIVDKDATIAALNDELSGSERRVSGADALVAALSANIATGDATAAGLQGELDGANGRIVELEGEVAGLNDQIAGLESQNQTTANVGTAQVDALNDQIAQRDATISDLNGRFEASQARVVGLNDTLTERQGAVDSLQADVDRLSALSADQDGMIVERDATIAGLNDTMTTREGEVTALQGEVGRLATQVADQDGMLAERDATIADLSGTVTTREGEVTALQGEVGRLATQVADRDASIDWLNGQMNGLRADNEAMQNAGDGDAAALNAQIAGLGDSLGQAEGEVARLTGEVAERDDALARSADQIATLTAAVDAGQAEVANLNGVVADRDATIVALQSQSAPVAATAEQCAAQASAAMEGSRINFASATARIDRGSVELLERLTGIALACVGEDLTVEVGGHTDSQGTDAVNQELSEARAAAIVAFMTERGVPADGLRAVGYGESQPIADNDTSAGRAENRRISFDWQAR